MNEVDGTKIIPDLSLDVPRIEKFFLSKTEKQPAAGQWDGVPFYELGDRGVGYICLATSDQLLYFVRHKLVRNNKLRLGRQVLVWRDPEHVHPAASGFAKHVFLNILLPKYKALIADQEQTKNGAAFWQHMLREAFQKNLYVYMLDRRSSPNVLVPFSSYKDVVSNRDKLWGTTEGHRRCCAVISKVELSLR